MEKERAIKVLEKWFALRHQTHARIETSWQDDSTYSELHIHTLLLSYLGVGSSKLVVLKSSSTVNSIKFRFHYQCLVIKKLNTLDTRNVLIVKSDMKFFVQLLLLKNSMTLPATVGGGGVANCTSFECKQNIGIPWSLQVIVNTTVVTYCVHFLPLGKYELQCCNVFTATESKHEQSGRILCPLQLNWNTEQRYTVSTYLKTKHKLSRSVLLSFSLNVNRNGAVVYSLLD
jgi:hypothetical protein